jgi:stage II sporulation protein D
MKKVLLRTLIVGALVLLLPFTLTLLLAERDLAPSIKDLDFTIYYEVNGEKEELTFNKYLLGVTAANMPASYNMEALKAQAVIARTYALYNISLLSKENPGKDTFTTSELGLSYLGMEELKQYWGDADYSSYFSRLENDVYATEDEVLVYEDELILPVFFDTGSGFTRSAVEAWNIDIPYLISVPSKQDVTSTNYLHITEYQVSELMDLLNRYYTNLSLSEETFFDDVVITSRDSAGYVLQIDLGDLTVSGEEFAKVLGLPSNHFYIENYEGNIRIVCNGAGHGVGLSQYGANAMAENGSTYSEILAYYYTGIDLMNLSGED